MSKLIAVRLPHDIVEFVDELVATGEATSRASVVSRALERERRRTVAANDVAVLTGSGGDPEIERETGLDSGQLAPQSLRVQAVHLDELVPRGGPAHHGDAAGGDPQAPGDQLERRRVGLSVHRRSDYAYQQRSVALAGDLVPTRARLNAHLDPAHSIQPAG